MTVQAIISEDRSRIRSGYQAESKHLPNTLRVESQENLLALLKHEYQDFDLFYEQYQ